MAWPGLPSPPSRLWATEQGQGLTTQRAHSVCPCTCAHAHTSPHAYPRALTPTQTTCAHMHIPTGCAHRHARTQCSHIPAHVCAHMSPKYVHARRHPCTWAEACTHNRCMCSHTHMHTHPGLPEHPKGWGHSGNGCSCLSLLLPSLGVPHHTGLRSCGRPAHASAQCPWPPSAQASSRQLPSGGHTGKGLHGSGRGLGHASSEARVLQQRLWPKSRGRLWGWPLAPQNALPSGTCRGGPLNTGPGQGSWCLV